RLIALSAKTGVPVPSFGRNGIVDLKLDDDQEIDLETGEVGLHATPVVAGDVVIVGAAHRASGAPKVKHNVNGYVRGFDARTGKRLWISTPFRARASSGTIRGRKIPRRPRATPVFGGRSVWIRTWAWRSSQW